MLFSQNGLELIIVLKYYMYPTMWKIMSHTDDNDEILGLVVAFLPT